MISIEKKLAFANHLRFCGANPDYLTEDLEERRER